MTEYWTLLWRTILQTLQFDQGAFQTVNAGWMGLFVAVGIAFLGGISLLIGQSVILFANRVRPPRFVASLLLNGVLYIVNLALWAWAVRVAAQSIAGQSITLSESILLMFLTAAPMLFGFLVLMPYLGSLIARLLDVWSLLIAYQIVMVAYGVDWWRAIGVVGGGWLLTLLVRNTIGWPLTALFRRLRSWVAGVTLAHSADELVVKFSKRLTARSGEVAELGLARRSVDQINTKL